MSADRTQPNAPSGITRIESKGSVWMIDNDLRRYCRFPKHEGPRERPEWSDERAGVLQDAIWHDFEGDWWIGQDRWLRIQVHKLNGEHEWMYALAPDSREEAR